MKKSSQDNRKTQEPPLVRASDIGTWAFCQRAWWLAQVKGVAHQRPALLAQGLSAHQTHGRMLRRANRLYRVALALIATGLLLIGLTLLWWSTRYSATRQARSCGDGLAIQVLSWGQPCPEGFGKQAELIEHG